jgi:hypothetical protein
MDMKKHVPAGAFVGQTVRVMLDRTPAWPHLGLGTGQIRALSDKHIKIEGILTDLGMDGTFEYEVTEDNPGAAAVHFKISANGFAVDCSKIVSCIEVGAERIVFYEGEGYKQLARLDCADGGLIPLGAEVCCAETPHTQKMYFEYM